MDIILLAVGISVDTFAAMSIAGAMIPRIQFFDLIKLGIVFGGWQALVVTLSSAITHRYIVLTSDVDPFYMRKTLGIFAIGILVFLGLYLFWKGRHHNDIEEKVQESLDLRKTFRLAIVTSVDSLLAGIALGILGVSVKGVFIPFTIVSIVAVFLGIYMGHWFGYEHKTNAYYVGGIIMLLSSLNIALNYCI